MAIPSGFRQAGTLDLLQTIEEGRQSEHADGDLRRRRQQIKAQAYAQVCSIYRVGVNQLTAQQRAHAEAVERRMLGEDTFSKGYGFSIPHEHRKPNIP